MCLQLYTNGMKMGDLNNLITNTYDLDDCVLDYVQFCYKQVRGTKGNTQLVIVENYDSLEEHRVRTSKDTPLNVQTFQLSVLTLKVYYKYVILLMDLGDMNRVRQVNKFEMNWANK